MKKNPLVAAVKKLKKEERDLERKLEAQRKKQKTEVEKIAETLVGREFVISEPRSRNRHGKFRYRIVQIHGVSQGYDEAPTLHYSAELVTRCENFRREGVSRKTGTVYRKRISLNRLNLMKLV